MPIEIKMPRLSDTMERGTILKWNVKEGDSVSSGDVIADVETDKATMEMNVYDDGTIAKIAVKEGESVGVGTVIALLAEKGEDPKEIADSAPSANGEAKAQEENEKKKDKDKDEDRKSSDEAEEPKQDKREEKQTAVAEKDRDEGRKEERDREAAHEVDGEAREDGKRQKVSPVARRLADEYDVDIRAIHGTGPGGRVIKRDILQAAEARDATARAVPPAAKRREGESSSGLPVPAGRVELGQPVVVESPEAKPLEEKSIQLSQMRQTIARRLVESKTTIPHYQVTYTFNMDPILALRKTLNEQLAPQQVKLSVNDFLVRASAIAMHRHHEFNASWAEDSIKIHGEANIGIAISLPPEKGGGLVVATIRNADRKGLRVISAESKQLAAKARTRGLSIEEMSDSTFTLSNLGMYGVEHFTAIINPPNSAILAVGAAVQKPVVRHGELAVGHEMQATLSCDHRIIDGAMAAEYLQTLKQLIENPATLLV